MILFSVFDVFFEKDRMNNEIFDVLLLALDGDIVVVVDPVQTSSPSMTLPSLHNT